MPKVEYCQSCAMPMAQGPWGTEADGTENDEYCAYCYKDGKFTASVDMAGMIDICVPHMLSVCPDMTEEKSRSMMGEIFPTLKRWRE